MRGRSSSLARIVPLALAGFAVLTIFAAGGSGAQGAGTRADTLRVRNAALADRSKAAVLELYSLDSALARARADVAAIEARVAQLRRERLEVGARLELARRTFTIAELRLGQRLRDLYEHGSADPVAVLLGSESLDQALATLEGLHRFASQDRSVVRQARSARAILRALSRRLAARERALERLRARAAAELESLERASAARRQYLAGLARRRSMNARRITALEAEARAARDRSARLTAPAAPPAAAVPVSAPAAGGTTLTVIATGYSLNGRTATGLLAGWGVVAVDPAVIPLGTRMTIPGYGQGIAADVGSAIGGATIDVWFPSQAQALAWGRRTVTITLHS